MFVKPNKKVLKLLGLTNFKELRVTSCTNIEIILNIFAKAVMFFCSLLLYLRIIQEREFLPALVLELRAQNAQIRQKKRINNFFMLYAIHKSRKDGVKTEYAQISVSEFFQTENLSALVQKYARTPKKYRPLFKFEESEKIAVLDFDTYKFFDGESLYAENNKVITRVRKFFSGNIVFEAVSPSNGVKVAINFDAADREDFKAFARAVLPFNYLDFGGSGFENNCFLPALFISVHSDFVPFELPKSEKIEPSATVSSTKQPKRGLFSLDEIAAKYPQTSKNANGSINSFAISAYRNGFSEAETIDFAKNHYSGTNVEKHISDAFAYASKNAKVYADARNFLKSEKTAIEKVEKIHVFETQSDYANAASLILKTFLHGKEKFCAIQAPTGTGKTYLFTNVMNEYFRTHGITVIFLVPTQSIAAQNGGFFGKISETDILAERENLERGGVIITTYDKANLFSGLIRTEKTFVVIDEAHEFVFSETYRKDAVTAVKSLIAVSDKVLFLSATLPKTFLELQVSENIETHIFAPKNPIAKNITLTRYCAEIENLFAEKLLPIAEKNKAAGIITAVQIDNKDAIKELQTVFEQRGFTVSAIYNHTELDFDENYQSILQGENKVQTDVLLCTKKINAGVNLRNDAMHLIYVSDLADKQGTNEFDVLQFFGRGRGVLKNPKDFSFEVWERIAKNPSEKKLLSERQKVAFLDVQKSKVRDANREIFAGIPQTFDCDDFNMHGGFFVNCFDFNEKANRYELSFSKIAIYFDADTRRNSDFKNRLTAIDSSYSFEAVEFFTAEKAKAKTETRAEKNAREISEISHILETDLSSSDKIRRVAKLSKNKQVKRFFGGAFAPCEIENVSGAELLLIFAAKLLSVGYSEKRAFAELKNRTYSDIETYISDAQNAFRYYTDAKNAIERSEKRFLEKIITAVSGFEKATLQELKNAIRKQFSNHNDYYGLQLHKLDGTKLRDICGFYFDFEYSKKAKCYLITVRNDFAPKETETAAPQTQTQTETIETETHETHETAAPQYRPNVETPF